MATYDNLDPRTVYQALRKRGLSHAHALGMVNNIEHESSFRPSVNEAAPLVPGSAGGYGLFQHTGPRRKALFKFAGGKAPTWQQQLDFALSEPDTDRYLAQDFSDPAEASAWFTQHWERPQNAAAKAKQRLSTLQAIAQRVGVDPRTTSTQDAGAFAVDPYSLPDKTMQPDPYGQMFGPDAQQQGVGLHPLVEQMRRRQSGGLNLGDDTRAYLRAAAGVLGAPTDKPLQWLAGGINGLLGAQGGGMDMLEGLQTSNELYKLEEARRNAGMKQRMAEAQRSARQKLADSVRASNPEQAAAIEADLLTDAAIGDIVSPSEPDAPTYGVTLKDAQIGEWEDGTPRYVTIRAANDGTEKMVPRDKGYRPVNTLAYDPNLAQEVAAGKARGTAWGAMRPEVIQTTNEALAMNQAQLNRSQDLLNDLDAGKFDNKIGPLRGRVTQYFDPDVAELRMQGVNEALNNLNVANLAPVSNFEIGLIQQLYANPNMTVAQNKAIMRSLVETQKRKVQMLQRAMERLRTESMEEYMQNRETVDLSGIEPAPEIAPEDNPATGMGTPDDPFAGYRRID